MLIAIDESGDSGFKFSSGSSAHFTCIAVLFRDPFEMDACDRAVDEVKRKLRLPPRHEFHFTESSETIRSTFLSVIAREKFLYYGFVLNKPRLYGEVFNDRHGFYDFTIKLICENARALIKPGTKILIDACGDRDFRRRLAKSLREQIVDESGRFLVKKVAMESSKSNNLIQIADMICGAVARSFNSDRSDRDRYRLLIQKRERRVQFWPK